MRIARAVPHARLIVVVRDPVDRAYSNWTHPGAAAGAHAPPQLWRAASVPLTWALQRGGGPRSPLPVEVRRQLVERFADDVHRLSTLTGEDFSDWLGDEGRGEFSTGAVGAAV